MILYNISYYYIVGHLKTLFIHPTAFTPPNFKPLQTLRCPSPTFFVFPLLRDNLPKGLSLKKP